MKKKSRRSGQGNDKPRPDDAAKEQTATGSSEEDRSTEDRSIEAVPAALADEAAAASEGPAEAAAKQSAPESTAATGSKKSLPAFGFAADLLKKAGSDSGTDSPSPAREPAPSKPAQPAPARAERDAAAALSGRAIDDQAPTRVFDFADRLNEGGRRGEEQAAPVKIGTFVAFDLAGETFAMPVEPVRQVVRVSSITRVPHAPRPIRGVTNLRGRVIPVIDLRLRIGLPETEVSRSSRVVSVSSRGRLIGLLVDAVHQVIHLDLFKVQPPPDDVMTLQSDYIEGVYGEGDDLILLLDIDKALIIREAGAA